MSRNLQKKTCCYPKYLNVRSPARAYKVIRAVFFLACVLTCIISPDLTMGILFFLFLFANFKNIWSFQILYSALISVVKITVSLLFSVRPSLLLHSQTDFQSQIFELFGLRGGANLSAIEPVDVSNFYSIVNGVIMALAGFNYLALVYQKYDTNKCGWLLRLIARTPAETKNYYMKLWVAATPLPDA